MPKNSTGSQYDDVFKPLGGGSLGSATPGKGGKLVTTTDGVDTVTAGSGNDKIDTAGGDDFAYGENGNDLIYLGDGTDTGAGGNGDDELHGGAGNDTLWGDSVGNTNTSDNGTDTLYGDAGDDQIHGGNGKDFLWGGDDDDTLFGDNGVDWLRGGTGVDHLWGGLGGDVQFGSDDGSSDGAEDIFYIDTNTASSVSDSPYKLGAPIVAPYTNMDVWDVIAGFVDDEDKVDLDELNDWLSGGGPTQLTWRGAVDDDAAAGVANGSLAHGVWVDEAGQFLYADITGDGKADMKVQVSGIDGDDLLGINFAPETDDVNICAVEDDDYIAITLSGSDPDGTVESFHIVSLPSDGVLATNSDGSGAVSVDDIIAAGTTLYFIPSENWSGTATFDYAAIDDDNAEDLTPATVTIDVAPVADAPMLDLDSGTADDQHTGAASGDEDTAIALDIAAALVDTDGSETLSITITVPDGATLSAGTDNLDGTWTLTAADLVGLTINVEDPGSYTLTVTATATEADPGFADEDCDDTSDNVATTVGTINLTVNEVNQQGGLVLPTEYTGDDDPNNKDDVTGGGTYYEDVSNPDLADPNILYGSSGADAIEGRGETDTIYGWAGDDTIDGGNDTDTIYGGSGNDTIDGGEDADTIYGGSGQDTINGKEDNDDIIGGYGADTLTGFQGADEFIYLSTKDTNDTITNFQTGIDKINVVALSFDSISMSVGQPAAFASANDLVWYVDGSDVVVVGDTDGNLGTAEFMITLSGIATVANTDFILS